MRDHEKLFHVLTTTVTDPSAGVDAPATPSTSPLSLATWEALPFAVRASDRLAGMLLALDDIETDLSSPDAAALRWIAPEIEHVGATVRAALQKLAS